MVRVGSNPSVYYRQWMGWDARMGAVDQKKSKISKTGILEATRCVLHNEYMILKASRAYWPHHHDQNVIPKLERLYCPWVEVATRPSGYKGSLDSAKRRVVTLPRSIWDNTRVPDSGLWMARQLTVRTTDVRESSNWQDSVTTVWIDDIVENLLSLVDSLEDELSPRLDQATTTDSSKKWSAGWQMDTDSATPVVISRCEPRNFIVPKVDYLLWLCE